MNNPARPRWYPLHWLVAAATLLAAVLRFWHLSSLPPQAWYDEIWFALRARDLLQTGQWHAHYDISNTAGNAGLVYLTALVQLIGIKSIVAARVAAALAGTLTIPLTYACLRELLGEESAGRRRAIAGLAALILSYLLFMVILSRVGMEPSMAPPAALFVVWQMARGLRRADWRSWAAAGLIAGLAQYNGPHARLILLLAGYLIIEWYFGRGETLLRHSRRQIIQGALLMGVVGLVVTIPLIVTFAQHPDWLFGREAEVSGVVLQPGQANPPLAVADNGLRVLGAWLVAGDANARHNLPGQPMLDPALGIGFLVGLGWAIWNIRRPTARLLIIWLLLMALPAALTAEAPNMQRMIGVAPPTAALVAMGWANAYEWLRGKGWDNLRVASAAGAVLIIASLGWNVYLLFGPWAHSPQLPEAFTSAPVNLARQMLARAQSGAVYAERIPEDVDLPAFDFLFANTPVTRVDFRECLPLDDGPVTYLALSERDAETLGRLARLYPEMVSSAQSVDLSWQGQATLLQTPAGATFTPPGHQTDAQFEPGLSLYGYDWSEPTVKAGQTLHMSVYWLTTRPIGANLTALFHIVPAGVYDQPPVAQHDGPPCGGILYPTSQWKPGEIIVDWFEIALPADLLPGEYEIAAGWYDPLTLARSGVIEAEHPLPDGRAIIGAITVTAP